MKSYRIVKTFRGSQDGRIAESFEAGSVADLSDSLGAVAVFEGWAVDAKALEATPANKALDATPNNKRRGRR